MTSNKRLDLVRAAWGTVLLTVPGIFVGGTRARWSTTAARRTIQVLGGRQVIQAAVTTWRPTTTVLTAGVASDVLHAASMVALAMVDTRWRKRATADAALAALLAFSGTRAARRKATAVRHGEERADRER